MSDTCKRIFACMQLLALLLTKTEAAPASTELHLEDLEHLYTEANVDENQRNAVKGTRQLWPSNTIYYRIADDYTATQRDNVHTALSYFNEHTCLTFAEYNGSRDDNKRYVYYKSSEKMCGTQVGYKASSAPHDVLLNPYCLDKPGVIQHETLHVLGLFHEQSRPDRNAYVSIVYDNIPLRYWSQFTAKSDSQVTTYNVPYDYDSIMHYSQNAFARDPAKPTIRAKEGEALVDRPMGQIVAPSEGDLTKIRIMYKCNDVKK